MFFENKDCEFYPCHQTDRLNCLFCFCPLYSIECGGNFKQINKKNGQIIKDCSDCLLPHTDTGYNYIIKMLKNTNNEKQRG